ncbi:MAG: nicotinate-nucleotide adenylyltransferase [Myxococcota bacterium]|nr:nicotinate-nucleotide adenylyltransferase [Myxococcota bacterium]
MVGIFGGTFNPIHLGHLRAAEEVLDILGLDQMIFIPSARPPHKSQGQETIAPAEDRLDWVRHAVANDRRFCVDPIEVERPGPSYLVDTLTSLHEKYAAQDLVFILGQDAFSEMGDWKSPEQLFTMANFAVIVRPPARSGRLQEWTPQCARNDFIFSEDGSSAEHRTTKRWIRRIPITALDISSTRIRKRVGDGVSLENWVPENIRSSIEKSEAYRTRSHPDRNPPN